MGFMSGRDVASISDAPAGANQTVTGRGPHSRTWATLAWETNGWSEAVCLTNVAYTELEIGLHRRNPSDGSWVESSAKVAIQPDGGALGQGGQDTLYLPGSLYSDALTCSTWDGQTLTSRPIGLALFDGQHSALIAELRDGPVGQLLPPGSVVIYTNICTDLRCDLLVEYKKSGYEASLILRERFDPSEWGFTDPSTVRVQWLTEFFGSQPANITETTNHTGFIDALIDFGSVQMGQGKGFLLGDPPESGTRVYKHWQVMPDSGRVVLSEEIRGWRCQIRSRHYLLIPPLSSCTGMVRQHRNLPASLICCRRHAPSGTRPIGWRLPKPTTNAFQDTWRIMTSAALSPILYSKVGMTGRMFSPRQQPSRCQEPP